MDNNIEINQLVAELSEINKNTSLDSFEKRKLQSYVFIANCNGPSDEYKDLMSDVTHLSFQIQNYLQENNIDLKQTVLDSSELTDESKQVLLSYTSDLKYLTPRGGFIELLPGLEFNQDTVEAIKFWVLLAGSFVNLLAISPKSIKSIQDIIYKHYEIQNIKLKNQKEKIELYEKKKNLTRSERHKY
ncbi:hypothetical protein [Enterococcus gallinarum]|uniref:Uncharacterized protein n=1 Tax=Enterococcus gallinarum TaxID=1353 RepID=A0ABD4ZX21_ENTGA|nr:hypothetical protein [Enterococcus gallinarum]MBF0824602.1 hypothetical protein [Enterococcus faecalis]MBA0948663.1 hypothetical protein [Enterococcus gallinarum]MBA0961695.1 hypothetical protein [Enterococcus gallinarum]MBA0969633.1 hypothetical protein [Enterococcus gallinarum]MBA0972995.1 hypothetical protein [Enterococcus gallinarum]